MSNRLMRSEPGAASAGAPDVEAPKSERVCVGAVLVRSDRRVLLGRRARSRAWLPGVWDVPGGHCEPGEAPEAALVRELSEEIGITPRAWTQFAPAREGDVTLHLYQVTSWDGFPRNAQPEEHDVLAWLSADDACRLPLAHAALAAVIHQAVGPVPPLPP